MGVKRLTTYVQGVERNVSTEATFACRDAADATKKAHFIVDAWAFIFHLWMNHCGDALRGLEYAAYQQLVRTVVQAWSAAGIRATFIFDGPILPAKLPTVVSRRARIAACNQAFMKSSPQSRVSRRFQRECGVLPPMMQEATVDVLYAMQQHCPVQIFFAPTEADSLVAEMAAREKNGYALSQDSDYFILCARSQGCAGYVPLETLEYIVETVPAASGSDERQDVRQEEEGTDDGFEQVGRRKRGGRRTASDRVSAASHQRLDPQHAAALPPLPGVDSGKKLQGVRIRAYSSHRLAAQLQVPPSSLPLLAAIVGNDYTNPAHSKILLGHVDIHQQIATAAGILRTEWARAKGGEAKVGLHETAKAASSTRKASDRLQMTGVQDEDARSDMGSSATATPTRGTPATQRPPSFVSQDPVRAIVEGVVDRAIAQAETAYVNARNVASGERAQIVDSIIESAATYSLLTQSRAPHLASPSALFFGEAMSLLASFSNHVLAFPDVIALYREAHARGQFAGDLIEVMTQRILLTHVMPEDTEVPSVQTTAARMMRSWLYAILFEAWGMSWAREQWELPLTDNDAVDAESEGTVNGRSKGTISFAPDSTYREGERPDDVISVDTESSHSEVVHDEVEERQDELPSRPASVNEGREPEKPAPGVVEYVRAGSHYSAHMVRIAPLLELLRNDSQAGEKSKDDTRASHEHASLPSSLVDLLGRHEAAAGQSASASTGTEEPTRSSDPRPPPVALSPLSVRLDVFLHAHRACTPAIKALPQEHTMVAGALRAIFVSEAERLGPGRTRHNWSYSELLVAVQAAVQAQAARKSVQEGEALGRREDVSDVLPSSRAVHLASTMLLVLRTSHHLAQALLLTRETGAMDIHPHACFDGPFFYAGMARIHEAGDRPDNKEEHEAGAPPLASSLSSTIVHAITGGYTDALGIDAVELKRERKTKKREAKMARMHERHETSGAPSQAASPRRLAYNSFALLEEER